MQRTSARNGPRDGIYLVAVALWLAAASVGLGTMLGYESRPGTPAHPASRWPEGGVIRPARGRSVLLLFAHPRCPCTRASLWELNVLMSRLRSRVEAYVVFVRPSDVPEDWTHTRIWSRAEEIPGTTVLEDVDGHEARRFGVATSGQIVLYDDDGRLQFSGGMTAARGHEGDNLGRRRIESLLLTGTADETTSPVFGCALFDPDDAAMAMRGE